MVSFTFTTAAALFLLPLAANAYITGFTVPSTTAAAGTTVNATLSTALYSQKWVDFGIVWGLVALGASSNDCDTCVGTQVGYTTLTGDEGTAYPYTFTDEVEIPAGTAAGTYVLKAAIPRLIGASGATSYSYYSANITVTSS